MELHKYRHVFSNSSRPDRVLVMGLSYYTDANGVYAWDSEGSMYALEGTPYSMRNGGEAWGLFMDQDASASGDESLSGSSSPTAIAYASSASGPDTSPAAVGWEGCMVLGAVALSIPAQTYLTALSVLYTGGVNGGYAAMEEGGIIQPVTVGPYTTLCVDSRQVFAPGRLHFAGQPGIGVQLSYVLTESN